MKKIIGIIACLAVAAAVGAYFFAIPKFESTQIAQVEALISKLPGDFKAESIKAHLGNQLEILGLKGTIHDGSGGDIKIDAKRITISGINMTPGQGIVDLVDEAVFEGLTFHGSVSANPLLAESGFESTSLVVTQEFKEMAFKGLRGDYAALHSAVASGSHYVVLDCLATKFFADQFSASEYSYQIPWFLGPINTKIKSTLIKDIGGLKYGHAVSDGISISLAGSELLSAGSMTVESCQIPNIYQILMKTQEQDAGIEDIADDLVEALVNADENNGFVVKGLVFKDLKISPTALEPITFAELNFEWSLFKNNWIFKNGVREMILPVSLYQKFGGEFFTLARTHNKSLNMDAMVDFAVRGGDGKSPVLTVNRAFIEDKSLANVELSFTASVADFEKTRLQGNAVLTNGKFSFEDKDLINLLVVGEKYDLADGIPPEKINDPAYLRGVIANQFALDAKDNLPHSATKLMMAWFELLKAPGTLTMSYEIKPERPFIIGTDMQLLEEFPFEDLTVEFVPAK